MTTTSRTIVTTHETSTETDYFEDDPVEQSTVASSGTPTRHNATPVPSTGNISFRFVVMTSPFVLFLWLLYFLFFVDLQILITSLVSSNFSYVIQIISKNYIICILALFR